MGKIKSAFTLLYLLSLWDHPVLQIEIQIIQDWLQSTYLSPLSFKPHLLIQQLCGLSPLARHQEFIHAAVNFQQLTDTQQRLDFLRFALLLIDSDLPKATLPGQRSRPPRDYPGELRTDHLMLAKANPHLSPNPTPPVLIESLAEWWNIDLPTFFSTEFDFIANYLSCSNSKETNKSLVSFSPSAFGRSLSITPDSYLSVTHFPH